MPDFASRDDIVDRLGTETVHNGEPRHLPDRIGREAFGRGRMLLAPAGQRSLGAAAPQKRAGS